MAEEISDPNQSIKQDASCESVGGNSPITDSCTNDETNTNTDSGGNVGSGNSANGGSIGQAVKCITVGGNYPITDSCTNKGTNTILILVVTWDLAIARMEAAMDKLQNALR